MRACTKFSAFMGKKCTKIWVIEHIQSLVKSECFRDLLPPCSGTPHIHFDVENRTGL